jgi:hypothetical protein
MKWFWLKDGAAALLRGLPTSDSKKGPLNDYEELRKAIHAKVLGFWRKKSLDTVILEEANGCIV